MTVNDGSYEARRSALPDRVEIRVRSEQRRRWSDAEKLATVRETLASAASQPQEEIPAITVGTPEPIRPGLIEVKLATGVRLRVGTNVDGAALRYRTNEQAIFVRTSQNHALLAGHRGSPKLSGFSVKPTQLRL